MKTQTVPVHSLLWYVVLVAVLVVALVIALSRSAAVLSPGEPAAATAPAPAVPSALN